MAAHSSGIFPWDLSKEQQRAFWNTPRIRGPLLDSLLRMELHFEDGRLLVHHHFKADASTPQFIMTTVADGRVDDIAMAVLGSDLPSLRCFTRDWSAVNRRLRSCQAALLQIVHQWLGQDR